MAMMRAGAYSAKFQNLEKECMQQLKEQDKVNRGKAQLYSKQTAQRQRALEDKKKAMIAAEEDRRKKALEERREAQKAATKRFRSALGRIKSTSTKGQGQPAKNTSQAFLEYYLPSKPKHTATLSQSQKQEEGQERRALGRDVEVKLKPKNGYHLPRKNGLQHRTPSLDDVMGKIKGERSVLATQEPTISHGTVIIHQKVPEMFLEQSHTMGKRSSSDPTLNNPNHISNVSRTNSGKFSSRAISDLRRHTSDENIVFRVVPSRHTVNGAKMEEDLRITSPDTPVNSSSESLLSNPPLTPDLNDSLDTPKHSTVFTIGGEKLVPNETAVGATTGNIRSATQPIYVCENNVTDSLDSLEEKQAPKQNRTVYSAPVSKVYHQQSQFNQDAAKKIKEKPKIVGILKSKSLFAAKRTDSSKSKKVWFSDQLETSYSNGTPRKGLPNADAGHIDPAKLELWKRVLPNGVTTQYLPNSAFTPKMKVSLSSKASQSPSTPPPTNGLNIHIPVPTTEAPVIKPDSPNCDVPVRTQSPGEPPNQRHVSMASVGLNGVVPTSESYEDPLNISNQELTPNTPTQKQILLENTPTDDEINKLWDQIRNALEDNQKVFVPPQVFNFRVHHPSRQDPSSASSVASNGSTVVTHREDERNVPSVRRNASADRFYSRPNDIPSQRGPQRKSNLSRSARYQSNFSPQSGPLLARRGHGHAITYPAASRTKPVHMTSTGEPDTSRATGSSRKAPTALSLEEKKLMLSIENLNQKIRDHMKRHPNVAKFQSPISPESPDLTEVYPHPPPSPTPPQMHRILSTHPHHSHINSHTYKSRPRRSPKTVALATTTTSSQPGDYARPHNRGPPQRRTMFYNT